MGDGLEKSESNALYGRSGQTRDESETPRRRQMGKRGSFDKHRRGGDVSYASVLCGPVGEQREAVGLF